MQNCHTVNDENSMAIMTRNLCKYINSKCFNIKKTKEKKFPTKCRLIHQKKERLNK